MSDRKVDSWIGAGTIVSTSLAPVDSGMVRDAGVAGASPPGGGTSLFSLPPNFIHPASDADDSLLARDGWMAVCVNQLVSGTLNLPLHYLQNKAVISTSLSLKQENNSRRERR
jgi:hypothetical protein